MGASFPSGFYFMIWNCITHVLVYGYYFLKGSKEILMKLSVLSCIVTLMECFLVMLQSWMGIIFKRTRLLPLAFKVCTFLFSCVFKMLFKTFYFPSLASSNRLSFIKEEIESLFRRIKFFSTQLKRI